MIDSLNASSPEYERRQNDLTQIIRTAEELVEKNFQQKYKDQPPVRESARYNGDFMLPREGYQTFHLSFWAADPNMRGEPDVILAAHHNIKEQLDDDKEIQYAYKIRQTPDRDYVLESYVRDMTASNRQLKTLDEVTRPGMSDEEMIFSVLSLPMQEVFTRTEAELAAGTEERQLGLHASTEEDITALKKLLADAEPFDS